MDAPRVIFVATDLSTSADIALREAGHRARAAKARLIVCHVVPDPVLVSMVFPERHVGDLDTRTKLHVTVSNEIERRMSEQAGMSSSEYEVLLVEGNPYSRIVECAEQTRADLIVIGERGATGLRRIVLGSVADKIIRYAHAPVLVARDHGATRRIVVATDLSEPSMPAVAAAANEVSRAGGDVLALHCIDPFAMPTAPEQGLGWSAGVTPQLLDAACSAAGAKLDAALERFGLNAARRILVAAPARAIAAAAEELDADLVVIGTHGKTGLNRILLGSVAEAVIRLAPCSVLVVRLVEA